MQSKTWNVKEDKLEAAIKLRERFGWVEVTHTPCTLTMRRDTTKTNKKLAYLEKEYDYCCKKFSAASIIWLVLGLMGIFISLAVQAKWSGWYFVMLVGLAFTFIGVFLLFMTIVTAPYKKKLRKRILNQADEISGRSRTLPLPVNMKKTESHAFAIKNAVYNAELRI